MDPPDGLRRTLTNPSAQVLALFVLGLVLFTGVAAACSVFAIPIFSLDAGAEDDSQCRFTILAEDLNESDDVSAAIRSNVWDSADCSSVSLSSSDERVLRETIEEYGTHDFEYVFARIVVDRQSPSEYARFRGSTWVINNDPCDCRGRWDIQRREGWTIYVDGRDCGWNQACQPVVPWFCSPLYLLAPFGLVSVVLLRYPRSRGQKSAIRLGLIGGFAGSVLGLAFFGFFGAPAGFGAGWIVHTVVLWYYRRRSHSTDPQPVDSRESMDEWNDP